MKKSTRGRLASAFAAVALVASSMFLASPAYAADDASLFVACEPGDPGVAAVASLEVSGPTDIGFTIDDVSQGTIQTVNTDTAMPVIPRISVGDGSHVVKFWVGTSTNIVGAPLAVTFPQACGGDNSGGDPSASISSFGATASGNDAPRSIALQGEAALENIDGQSVTVSFTITGPTTLTAPNATVASDGSFSSSVSGQTIPDGTYTVTAQVLIDGTPSGASSSTTVTFTAPPVDPDPVPATVSSSFTGVLVDNTSTVNYSVTVTPNDDEGPFTVIIRDGDGNIVDELTFTEGGTQTGSFIYECGAAAFTATLEGDEVGEPQIINVPCHVPDNGGGDNSGGDGGDGGNNGGDGGTGGNNGGNTGGTGGTDGTNTAGGDTSGGSTDTNADIEAPPGAATGDNGPITWLISLGVVLLAAAAFVVARRKGIFTLIAARCTGILVR